MTAKFINRLLKQKRWKENCWQTKSYVKTINLRDRPQPARPAACAQVIKLQQKTVLRKVSVRQTSHFIDYAYCSNETAETKRSKAYAPQFQRAADF
ncbi:hypothetical protein D5396_01440 [Rahnella inusitata]|uniref:Uncharacterized protein n=1 Tax=Rahnella inusitata TaxID=58169 RepID=A0ABX9P493_9GAMM|nr:hypothetical protein D5396_01440 [Rahnella inusitata]